MLAEKNCNTKLPSLVSRTIWLSRRSWRCRPVRLWMSKRIPPSHSAKHPGWQHSGHSAKDQLSPASQTISTAGAVCMDQQPTLHSSAIALAGEMPKTRGGTAPQVLHYTTSSVNGIYWFIWHNVNLWSCLFSVRVSKRGSKQTGRDSAWHSSNPKVSMFSLWRCHSEKTRKTLTVSCSSAILALQIPTASSCRMKQTTHHRILLLTCN